MFQIMHLHTLFIYLFQEEVQNAVYSRLLFEDSQSWVLFCSEKRFEMENTLDYTVEVNKALKKY